jgi:hypothetical protein
MKFIYLPIIALLFLSPVAAHADQIDGITWLLKQGKIDRLSQFLAPTVELTVDDKENTFSKRQTMDFLNKFFSEHKPQHVSLLHKVNSNSKFLFGVIIYDSTAGVYRISLTLNEIDKSMQVIEMRIENGKD